MKNTLKKSQKLKFGENYIYPVKPEIILVTAFHNPKGFEVDILRDNSGKPVTIPLSGRGSTAHRMDLEINLGYSAPHLSEASAVFLSFEGFNINDQKAVCYN